MATTFDVFYLGTASDIDPTEGNGTSENASAIVGTTFGSIAGPLVDHIQTLSPGTAGYSGGNASGYDVDNNATNDQFQINGGADQTMDGMGIYNATITYTDGTTDTVTATVLQDTTGNLYLVPRSTYSADQAALELKPIRSLTLDSLPSANSFVFADRYDANYAVCFTLGTAIQTPQGPRLIEELRPGDLVTTFDNGPCPIRWIGTRRHDRATLVANPDLRPVLIRRGLWGAERDLLVSPQHALLVGRDHLVAAKHLAGLPRSRLRIAHGKRAVTYIHLMFDAHQIVFAEGTATESFYPGPMAQNALVPDARQSLHEVFPALSGGRGGHGRGLDHVMRAYGATARPRLTRRQALQDVYRAGGPRQAKCMHP